MKLFIMNNNFTILVLLWFSMILILISSVIVDAIKTPLLINCGLTSNQLSVSSSWRSDDDPAFAPPDINDVSISVTNTTTDDDEPLKTARLFRSPVTYTFSITPGGPIFLRLYFSTTLSYNNTLPYQFSTSLLANNVTLLHNFNPFLNSNYLPYEFQLVLPNGTNNLNLTFSPGNSSSSNNNNNVPVLGYVNGIEIRSIPEGLYINVGPRYNSVTYPKTGYYFDGKSTSFQTAYRLNVGGENVASGNDSSTGGMMRAWEADDTYIVGLFYGFEVQPNGSRSDLNLTYNNATTPSYVAPEIVYATTRTMGSNPPAYNLARNLTWGFEVDPGFDYLVRLHLCEMDESVTGSSQKVFSVYIGGLMAEPDLDIWAESGGLGHPMYKDYVISVSPSNGSKVNLSLAIHPVFDRDTDASLNGLEILKLSANGNLAVPNPPYIAPSPAHTPEHYSPRHNKTGIIIGVVVGGVLLLLLLVLLICVLIALYRSRGKKTTSYTTVKSSSTGQWLPASVESQSSTTNANSSRPSLPSNLCRCFSLGQIRVATCDFDENSIIGTGGFGQVYKGCIDDGATTVAIKRLNPLSKQGAHEFVTEIEMLSRLRHVHLVSLIGYCDEQGEMILVYEYMARGTLRDNLNYKKKKSNDDDDNNNNDESTTTTTLSWKQRLMVCLGSARGLHYLHTSAKHVIIHRDVKSTNILLDDKWTAKVSDFGLSKVGPDADDTGVGHVSTAVKGSVGYLDPEYYRRQQLTEKSDVYSFGVVLFEVLCNRPAVNTNLPKEQVNLAYWGRNCYNKGTLHTIVDPNLSGQIAPECLKKFGEVAEMCVRDHGDERPSMGDIVWSLQFALDLQQTAENNNPTIGGGPIVEVSSLNGGGDDDGGSTDKDMLTNTSSENLWQSNDSVSTSSNNNTSTTNYGMGMKSGSVFSEIMDPRAR